MPAWSLGKAPRGTVFNIELIGGPSPRKKRDEPGPGEYGTPNDKNVRRESPGWKMGKARREQELSHEDIKIPGPGAYEPKLVVCGTVHQLTNYRARLLL